MRSLKKEERKVYISQKLPPVPIKDADGNETGEFASLYDEPTALNIDCKVITDITERQAFGTDVKNILKATYTLYDVDGFSIEEEQAAWIGVIPNGNLRDDDISKPMNNNYTVEQVLPASCQIVAYFKKVAGATKA